MAHDRSDFISGPVPARDGHFALTLSRAHFWRDAMNELGLPELANDDTFWSRVANRDELAQKVQPAIARRGKYELFEKLSTLRAVSGMVLTTEELYANEHVRDRVRARRRVEHPAAAQHQRRHHLVTTSGVMGVRRRAPQEGATAAKRRSTTVSIAPMSL